MELTFKVLQEVKEDQGLREVILIETRIVGRIICCPVG